MIYPDECEYAGLNIKEVEKIAKGIEKYTKMAEKLGLVVFGGSACCTLRWYGDAEEYDGHPLVVASVESQNIDGGDGGFGELYSHDGFMRGE